MEAGDIKQKKMKKAEEKKEQICKSSRNTQCQLGPG